MFKKIVLSKLSILLFLILICSNNTSATHILPDDFDGSLTVPQVREILFMVGGSKSKGYTRNFGDPQGIAFTYYARRLNNLVRLPDNDDDMTIDVLATISDNNLAHPLVYYKLTFTDPQGQLLPYCFAILRTDMRAIKNTEDGYEKEHSIKVINNLRKYDRDHRIVSTAENEETENYFKKLKTMSKLDNQVLHKENYEKTLLKSKKLKKTPQHKKKLKNLERTRSFSSKSKLKPTQRKSFSNLYDHTVKSEGLNITKSISKEIKKRKMTPRPKIQEQKSKRETKNLKIKKGRSFSKKKKVTLEEENSSSEN